jgi:hypothetical protein
MAQFGLAAVALQALAAAAKAAAAFGGGGCMACSLARLVALQRLAI